MTHNLNTQAFYMNPFTGSVGVGQEWVDSFQDQDLDWEEWGGESLIEVQKDADGEWIEV